MVRRQGVKMFEVLRLVTPMMLTIIIFFANQIREDIKEMKLDILDSKVRLTKIETSIPYLK